MARGQSKKRSTWDRCVERLLEERCRFRMTKNSKSNVIYIREIENGKRVKEFSSQVYRHTNEQDIESCAELCRASDRAGAWDSLAGGDVSLIDTWRQLAE